MFHQHGNLRNRTREFARRVARAARILPWRDPVAREWGCQLIRADGSVGANYREAQRSRSAAEYKSKLGDCLREADETLYWIELLELEEYFPPCRIAPLKDECGQLIAIFVTLITKD